METTKKKEKRKKLCEKKEVMLVTSILSISYNVLQSDFFLVFVKSHYYVIKG